MKLSVIIPTYNEADVILDCLDSLSKQTFKDFEVIVVDDESCDTTSLKLRGASKTLNLKVLNQDHKGAGAARNLGAKNAKGEILIFVDADMTFDRNFLKMLTAPIRSGKVRGTFSKHEVVSNWDRVWAKCWNYNEGWEVRRRHPKKYPDHQPVFRAILKSEFEKVGGYTPGGYDDDWSLGKKLGYDAENAPGAIFYHKNPSSLREVFRHARWVGKRKYKLGPIGFTFALIRSSLPVSILIGLLKGIIKKELRFVIFKIIYDLGVVIGIISYSVKKSGAK